MTHPMNCEQFAEQLSDLLEREIDEPSRASMESHALACEDCGPLLADLRRLRIDAANLPELTPSRDLWSGIEARIATPVIELPARGKQVDATGRGARRFALGLAAAGLVAMTAGVTYVVTKHSVAGSMPSVAVVSTPAKPDSLATTATAAATIAAVPAVDSTRLGDASRSAASRSASVQPVSNNAKESSAESTYEREIARLRAVVNQRRSQLDPQTVGVVELNLRVIDEAIAQCKRALLKDPASRFLMESLNEELENKVELLRRAAVLPLRSS